MEIRHGISPRVANEALDDPNRLVVSPDYNSASGRSTRVIGHSTSLDALVTVIVLEHEGREYGVNGWVANDVDQRLYREGGPDE